MEFDPPRGVEMSKPERVLIVDDEYDLADLLKAYFEGEGITAEICSSGLEALVALKNQAYGAVLTDIAMPVMDGADLLVEIQKLKNPPPVILMTGYNSISIEDVFERGASELMRKPFSPQDALNVILSVSTSRSEQWSPKEPSKWRPKGTIQLKLPAYQEAKSTGQFNLGTGGFYIPLIPEFMVSVDDVVSFEISFEDPDFKQFSGIGRVRWVKLQESLSNPPGYGIQILELRPSCLDAVIHEIEYLDRWSFIPKR